MRVLLCTAADAAQRYVAKIGYILALIKISEDKQLKVGCSGVNKLRKSDSMICLAECR